MYVATDLEPETVHKYMSHVATNATTLLPYNYK